MDDYISRQAAIDATWEEPTYTDPINVLTDVRDKIKALPSAQQWIPCSERLPEESGSYLVTKRQMLGQIQMAIGHYSSYRWSGNGNFHDVIAWMPLPKPYKEEV